MNHNNYSHELQANRVGKAKLCNYTANTANELPFSISDISRKVYTAIKSGDLLAKTILVCHFQELLYKVYHV